MHLNSLLPIARLPPEVLLIIFEHVSRSDKARRELLARGRRIIDCSHTRNTAHVLVEHGGRMVDLGLTVVGEEPQYVPPMLQFSAPARLECLTIAFERESHSPRELALHGRVLPDALTLIHVYDCIRRNHFPHLTGTHLYLGALCGLSEPGCESTTTRELLQLLAHTPALQHLHLVPCRPPSSERRSSRLQSLSASLRSAAWRLEYTMGPTDFAYRLLRLIELPRHALVRFDDLYCPSADENLSGLLLGLRNADLAGVVQEGSWSDSLVRFLTTFPFSGALATLKLAVSDRALILHVLRALPDLRLVRLSKLESLRHNYFDGNDEGEHEAVISMTALCDALLLSAERGPMLCPMLPLLNIRRTHYVDPDRLHAAALVEMTARRRARGLPMYNVTVDLGQCHVDDEAGCRAALRPIQGNIINGRLVVGADLQSWGVCEKRDVEAQWWWELPFDERAQRQDCQDILYDS
ncbi:hypothetical protein GY45DRAFT_1428085 [Cubamyces sp. BRFM 1775]|nr:hypothetical protein GY45DRAFT_1428085 [Cubamyces sp. BRFM 1775]